MIKTIAFDIIKTVNVCAARNDSSSANEKNKLLSINECRNNVCICFQTGDSSETLSQSKRKRSFLSLAYS